MKILLKSTSSPIIVSVSGAILVSNQSSVLDLVVAGNGDAATYNPRLVNAVVNVLPVNDTILSSNQPSALDLVVAGNGDAATYNPRLVNAVVNVLPGFTGTGPGYNPRLVDAVVNVLPVDVTILSPANTPSVLDLVVAGEFMGAEYNPRLVNAVVNVVSTNNVLPNVTSELRMPINSGDHIDVMIKTNGNGRTMPSVIASTVIEGSMQGDITGNVTGYRNIDVSNTTRIFVKANALKNSKLIMHPTVMALTSADGISVNALTDSIRIRHLASAPEVSVNITGYRNIEVSNTSMILAKPNAFKNSKLIMHAATSVMSQALPGIAAVAIPANVSVNATGYRNIDVSNTSMILAKPNALTNSKLIMHPGSPVMSLAPIATGGSASGQRSQVHSVKFGTMVSLLLTKDETDPTLIASTVTNMPPGFSLSSDSKSLTGLVAFTGTLSVGVTYSDDSTQTHYLESFIYDILNGS